MAEASVSKTAFIIPDNTGMIKHVLGPLSDFESGAKEVSNVLTLFRKANLTSRLAKCYFFIKEI